MPIPLPFHTIQKNNSFREDLLYFVPGKTKILQLLRKAEVKILAEKFGLLDAEQDEIGDAGCKIIIHRYESF